MRAGRDGRRDPGRAAPRLHPGAQRPSAPGPGRTADRCAHATRCRNRSAYRPSLRGAFCARSERRIQGRRGARQRPSGRCSTPARASTTPRRGTRCASWPNCSKRRSRRVCRARAPSRRIIRSSLGSGGRSMPKPVRHFLDRADLIFGIGCSFTKTGYGVSMPTRHDDHPGDARPGRSRQGRPGRRRPPRRRQADARKRCWPRSASGSAANRAVACRGGRRGDRRDPGGVAGAVDAEADVGRDAALALSGDPRSAADGRCRAHDHHPRCRQSARSTLAVLGGAHPAELSRLGQDDATRLRTRAWRWAPSWRGRTSSASTSGATRRSASPAWTSRRPCASGSRSSRSCSTTSRWRSSLPIMQAATEKYRSTDISGHYADFARALGGLRRARHRTGRDRPGDQTRDPGRRKRARRRCWSSSRRRRSRSRCSRTPIEMGGRIWGCPRQARAD